MKKMWSLVKIVGAAMALCTLLGGAGTAFASEENIALRDGIIVISDGTATYNSTKVENAFDGDLSTKWQISSNAAANRWIGIDAGEGETITFNKVTMYEEAAGETSAVPGYRLTGYKIEVSDDLQNWTTVAGGTTIGEGPVDIRFATQTARAVRFYTIGAVNNFPVILKEMEVYCEESLIPNIAQREGITYIGNEGQFNATKMVNAFDGVDSTSWMAAGSTGAGRRLGLDAGEGKTITFNKIVLKEAADGDGVYRVTGYKIQVTNDAPGADANSGSWTTVAEGTTIGSAPVELVFDTQTVRAVRYYSTGTNPSNKTPLIAEMEVYYDESQIPNIAQREGITYIGNEGQFNATKMVNAFDGVDSTSWMAAGSTGAGRRLGLDAGEGNTITFNKIVLKEAKDGDGIYRLRGFEIQVTNDAPGADANSGSWKTVATGTTIGDTTVELTFGTQKVRAVRFRSTATDPSNKTPIIAEMEVYYVEEEDGIISINEDSQYVLGDDNSLSNIAVGTMVEELFANITLKDESAMIGIYSKDGEEKMPDAYVMDNDVMKVIGSETTEFTLKLAEVVYTDAAKVTDAKDYLTKSEMSITPGMTIRASALVNSGKLILAYYDSDKKLAGCVYGEAVSGYDNLVSAELVIPADKEGCFAKAFVWEDMLPLAGVANIE